MAPDCKHKSAPPPVQTTKRRACTSRLIRHAPGSNSSAAHTPINIERGLAFTFVHGQTASHENLKGGKPVHAGITRDIKVCLRELTRFKRKLLVLRLLALRPRLLALTSAETARFSAETARSDETEAWHGCRLDLLRLGLVEAADLLRLGPAD